MRHAATLLLPNCGKFIAARLSSYTKSPRRLHRGLLMQLQLNELYYGLFGNVAAALAEKVDAGVTAALA